MIIVTFLPARLGPCAAAGASASGASAARNAAGNARGLNALNMRFLLLGGHHPTLSYLSVYGGCHGTESPRGASPRSRTIGSFLRFLWQKIELKFETCVTDQFLCARVKLTCDVA